MRVEERSGRGRTTTPTKLGNFTQRYNWDKTAATDFVFG
jgi:hypothetical protein